MEGKLVSVILPSGPSLTRSIKTELISFNNNNFIAYPSNKSIIILDPIEMKQFVYDQHKSEVTALAIHPQDYYMVSGDQKGNLIIWSLNNENLLIKAKFELSHPITAIQFHSDGQQLIVAAKQMFQFNLQTELQNPLPSPDQQLTSVCYYNKTSAIVTSISGQVFSYYGRKLAFTKSIDLNIAITSSIYVNNHLILVGQKGTITILDNDLNIINQQSIGASTIFNITSFNLLEKTNIVCTCADGSIKVLELSASLQLTEIASQSFITTFYSNQLLSLAFQKHSSHFYAFTLSGKFIDINISNLLISSNLENRIRFICCSKPIEYVIQAQNFQILCTQNKGIKISNNLTQFSILNEQKFDQIFQNRVLFAKQIDNGSIVGFTTVNFFTIVDDIYSQKALNITIHSVSQYNNDFLLFSAQKIIKFEISNVQTVVYTCETEEITSGDFSDGICVISTLKMKGVEIGEIRVLTDFSKISNSSKIFTLPIYVKITKNRVFAASSDNKFVIFDLTDFEKEDVWPTFSRLEQCSKITGRVQGILGTIVFGSKGWIELADDFSIKLSKDSDVAVTYVGEIGDKSTIFICSGAAIAK
ncbi:WD40 domain-containing protein [Spironucleus salmonicida]|uniref:WD40 domain-containing protein n=1 Tax=Spironucleus salmonicida TaxID=348837 RepID=V6LN86_9EUKA|nr:WD40 domain-containing protein [Spironucleus salmonicida]|eukprot:EST45166.1 WD40 domain-containing protein [Spironucleus salmonicida]